MTVPGGPSARRHVVHVVSQDLARGAQIYAAQLTHRLDDAREAHTLVALFAGEDGPVVLDSAIRLDVPPGRLRRLGVDPRALWRLRAHLREVSPAVVVAHGSEAMRYVVWARPKGTRVVYLRLGVADPRLRRRHRRRRYSRWLRRVEAIAGVSQEALDEFVELFGVRRDRLWLIPNGRDESVFGTPRARDDDAPVRLAWVGHMTAHKRPLLFIDVVRRLRDRGHAIEAWMAGDGPLLDDVRSAAADAPIEVLGRRDDVPALLVESDILCFTSSGEAEGLPGVLVEAGLAARAVVTTAVPGAATVIADGESGYIVDHDDIDAFVDATESLVRCPDVRARMGGAARRRCLDSFTLDASVTRWRALLDDLA